MVRRTCFDGCRGIYVVDGSRDRFPGAHLRARADQEDSFTRDCDPLLLIRFSAIEPTRR